MWNNIPHFQQDATKKSFFFCSILLKMWPKIDFGLHSTNKRVWFWVAKNWEESDVGNFLFCETLQKVYTLAHINPKK